MYITPDDLAVLHTSGTSPATIAKWILKAESSLARKLRNRGVSLTELAADPVRLPDVKDVLENAVLRVLRNPDGARSESEGDYSVTHNPLDSSGNVWFPKEDLDDLTPTPTRYVRSISLGLTDTMAPVSHCDDLDCVHLGLP